MSQTVAMQTPGTGRRAQARALLALALPLIGSNLAHVIIGLTDAVMLGWYDVSALAAVSLAQPYWFILFLLGGGFAWAVMPMVASAAEAGDTVTVRRVTRMGLWLSVAAALAFLPAFIWSGPVFRLLGQTPDMAALGQRYLAIVGWSMIPALFVITLRSFLSALELTRAILIITIGAAALNILLNWVLIFGRFGAPEMGLQGAAWATTSLHVASFVALVIYVVRKVPDYDLFSRLWRFDGQVASRVFRLGLPMGLTSVAEAGLFSFSAVMMGWLGEVPLAAHGIAMQLTSITFVMHLGLSQAATVRAGRAFGRRDEVALHRVGHSAILLSGCVAVLTVVLFLSAAGPLVGLFIDPDDPLRDAILGVGVTLVMIAALFQIVDAAQVLMIGLLRGVQDTGVPLAIAAVSYWVLGLPSGYLLAFPLGLGAVGIWYGMMIGLGAAAIMLSVRFWLGTGRLSR